MKNIRLFITFAVLMACQSQVEEPQTDYQQISDGFDDMFETSLNLTSSLSLISVEENTDEYTRIGLELGDISKWTQEYLNSEYFKGLDANLDLTLVLELDNYQRNLRTSDVLGSIVDTTTIFSENQKDIFNSLVTDVLNLDDLSQGYDLLNSFNEKLMTSSQFTEDEKIELLEISSYTQAYIAFMESGGADEIQFALQQSLEELGIENARIKGCSVDWRSVWAGSVTSGVIGAGIGFKAGCAGGTVAFPGLGTVTGCVGGTVFGFASGFLYGTIGSIAANLLTTCARGRVAASCGVMMNRGMSLPNTCFNKIDFNFKPGIKFNFVK